MTQIFDNAPIYLSGSSPWPLRPCWRLSSFIALSCGLFGDELLFAHAIELGLQNSLMTPGSSHPPLVRLIVSLIADPSQSSDWLLRLPSLVFAIGSVFVWQRVLKKLIELRFLRCLLLPAIALNPVWLAQAFQCLPYSALFFSAACIAWHGCDSWRILRYVAQQHLCCQAVFFRGFISMVSMCLSRDSWCGCCCGGIDNSV